MKWVLFAFIFCFFAPCHAQAQNIYEVHRLNFGKFAVTDNDVAATITIDPDGNVVTDDEIVMDPDTTPQNAEYDFDGLTGNVIFHIGINTSTPPTDGGLMIEEDGNITGPGGSFFTLGSFTANDDGTMTTTPTGEGNLRIGATLTTSANATMYNSGSYTGQYNITLFY